jgi:hypothetical protein
MSTFLRPIVVPAAENFLAVLCSINTNALPQCLHKFPALHLLTGKAIYSIGYIEWFAPVQWPYILLTSFEIIWPQI